MEQFLLPAHPSHSPTPAAAFSSSNFRCVHGSLQWPVSFHYLFSDTCRTQTSWDILPGDRHQQSRDSEKAKLKDAVITVLHKSIQCLSSRLLHIQNVQEAITVQPEQSGYSLCYTASSVLCTSCSWKDVTLNCFSLPLMFWKKDRGHFLKFWLFSQGIGLDCCVLALAIFSSHAFLAVQAQSKTWHAEIIFSFAAGLITAVI